MIYRKDFLGFSGVTGKILIELSQTRLANTQYQLFLEILKEFLLFFLHFSLYTTAARNAIYLSRIQWNVHKPEHTWRRCTFFYLIGISSQLTSTDFLRTGQYLKDFLRQRRRNMHWTRAEQGNRTTEPELNARRAHRPRSEIFEMLCVQDVKHNFPRREVIPI